MVFKCSTFGLIQSFLELNNNLRPSYQCLLQHETEVSYQTAWGISASNIATNLMTQRQ